METVSFESTSDIQVTCSLGLVFFAFNLVFHQVVQETKIHHQKPQEWNLWKFENLQESGNIFQISKFEV